MVETVVLSEKGQFVIPKRIRNKYGLAKGSKLVIFDDEGKLRIELADSIIDKLKSFEQQAAAMHGNAALSGDGASLPVISSAAVKRDAREIT
ncbi:MAG: AbrB/MazE/SpoVT family DNA-binding domain-containing protein [Candidatus Micrarchaeota archaeon]|nr:AbrB/MazE/SpoVT family DNA-binding domain-containing protein [Candidatus Micrarchaeota archaeon]